MDVINPWGGLVEGMNQVGNAVDTLSQQRNRDAALKLQMDAAAEDAETKRGLAAIYASGNQTKTVPDITASTVPSADPSRINTDFSISNKQVPAYTQQDIQSKVADYLASRGDWEGLKNFGNAIDVSSKIDQRSQTMLTNVMKSVSDMRKAGFDTASIKQALQIQADNLNRLNGQQIIDPRTIDTIDVNAAGDLITQDIGGGQKAIMVTQPNGMVTVHVVDTTKQQRVSNETQRINQSNERIQQGWARLNPRLQAELESSKAAGKQESEALIKGKDDYYNAQDSMEIVDEAEALIKKNPRNIGGVTAKFRGWLGSIDPLFEDVLNSGDRKVFERLMMNNMEAFKKLLGPQISNSDATLMFNLSGAGDTSLASIQQALRNIRRKNQTVIKTFERRQASVGRAAPATIPYTGTGRKAPQKALPKSNPEATTAYNPKTGETIYLNKDRTGWVDRTGKPVK
jgi:hypothetical protein